MNNSEEKIYKQLAGQKDIQEALRDVLDTGTKSSVKKRFKPISSTADKIYIITCLVIIFLLTIIHYAFHLDQLPIEEKYLPAIPKIIVGLDSIILVLLIGRLAKIFIINGVIDEAKKYNLIQLHRVSFITVLFLISLSIIYANWYTAVVSLGILSAILGFALQTPILSFIGWIYIIVRRPYKLGDIIKVGEDMGEVIDIDYLDTTMWELKGELSIIHPTGKIIRFPNSNILNASVFNHTWALFPFIYEELNFYISYDTDLLSISSELKLIYKELVNGDQYEKVEAYKEILKSARINVNNMGSDVEISFKSGENMWIQVIVIYPVLPAEAGKFSAEFTYRIFERFNQRDNKIFPSGNSR